VRNPMGERPLPGLVESAALTRTTVRRKLEPLLDRGVIELRANYEGQRVYCMEPNRVSSAPIVLKAKDLIVGLRVLTAGLETALMLDEREGTKSAAAAERS
jgi:DNA-binding transcriptional ArsR family regulator